MIKQQKVNNIVCIQHIDSEKEYVFTVPEALVKYVKKGSLVTVDTFKGNALGKVTTGVITGKGIMNFALRMNAHLPLKEVISVRRYITLKKIKIYPFFKKTPPNADKIRDCYEYYKQHKMLDREIVLNSDGYLVDGYVAYLVAKMFGVKYLTVDITAEPSFNSGRKTTSNEDLLVDYGDVRELKDISIKVIENDGTERNIEEIPLRLDANKLGGLSDEEIALINASLVEFIGRNAQDFVLDRRESSFEFITEH